MLFKKFFIAIKVDSFDWGSGNTIKYQKVRFNRCKIRRDLMCESRDCGICQCAELCNKFSSGEEIVIMSEGRKNHVLLTCATINNFCNVDKFLIKNTEYFYLNVSKKV